MAVSEKAKELITKLVSQAISAGKYGAWEDDIEELAEFIEPLEDYIAQLEAVEPCPCEPDEFDK